jgi:hypothetical protein
MESEWHGNLSRKRRVYPSVVHRFGEPLIVQRKQSHNLPFDSLTVVADMVVRLLSHLQETAHRVVVRSIARNERLPPPDTLICGAADYDDTVVDGEIPRNAADPHLFKPAQGQYAEGRRIIR